jgi:hypothetical protein
LRSEAIGASSRIGLDTSGRTIALWGARRPDQLVPIHDVFGRSLDDETCAEIAVYSSFFVAALAEMGGKTHLVALSRRQVTSWACYLER